MAATTLGAAEAIINFDSQVISILLIGFCFSLIGIISIMYIFYQYLNQGFQSGWPSIVVLIIFSTGLILTSTGVLGLYIGRIFDQVKGRPLYIIEEKVNFNHDFFSNIKITSPRGKPHLDI